MFVEWQWDEDFELPFYTVGVLPTSIVIPVPNAEAYEYAQKRCGVLLYHKWGHRIVIRKTYSD